MNISNADELVVRLRSMGDEQRSQTAQKQLELFGIHEMDFLGVDHTDFQRFADEIESPDHALAVDLWKHNIYEAKMLACMVADPDQLTEDRCQSLIKNSSSWVLLDFCCSRVLSRVPFAMHLSSDWAESDSDRLVYAGFLLIGNMASSLPSDHQDEAGYFDRCLFTARKQASRDNIYVSRAISSTIRRIGQRSADWHEAAVECSREIAMQSSRSAKWVAAQSLAELLTGTFKKS